VHDSGYVGQGDEDAHEDKDGSLEVGQEEDGGEVDGDNGKAHVPVELATNDLESYSHHVTFFITYKWAL